MSNDLDLALQRLKDRVRRAGSSEERRDIKADIARAIEKLKQQLWEMDDPSQFDDCD
jgi:predicted ABC-type ATPase